MLLVAALPACRSLQFEGPSDSATIRTPASWQSASTGNEGRISTGWLSDFNDPGLDRAVDQALARNQDLAAAAARMREAEYNRLAGRSRLLPGIDLGSNGSFSLSENGPAPASESERYGLSVSASWELDLWRRLCDLTLADEADAAAAQATYRGARLSIAAATARAWCNLIAAEQQLTLARETLDSFEANLRISERIYKGTGQGALDVQFGRTNVAAARRALESSRLQRDEAARTLELLTGRYPSGTSSAGGTLPELRRRVPAGLPSELVERRPDLVVARAQVFASAKRADAARKALLPSLRLTAGAGTPVDAFRELLDPQWLTASIAASVAQTLYAGGALTNQARAALERNRAAVHTFTQVALEAFREVEAALAADASLVEQERFLMEELKQSELAEKQSTRDYADGVEGADILDVLEAQRRGTNARASMIRLKTQRLLNRIDLHLALGGDFKTRDY